MQNKYLLPAKILVILLMVFTLSSCTSKRNVNKALKYDEAGMFQEAAAHYLRSLAAKPTNMDARLGLMRTGNLVLEEKLNAFTTFHRNRQHKEAVYAFFDAEKYYNNVAKVGVKLDFPDQNKVYFNESKEEYLSHLYQEGLKALNVEAFATAEPLLAEILNIDAAYKDTHEHWVTAKYEPIYRNGLGLVENGLHRKAFYTFDKIIKETGAYKESVSLKDQSLKAATITIGVLPYYVQDNGYKLTATELRAKTINEIHQIKSPFYKLINDPAISNIPYIDRIKEPQVALSLIQQTGKNISAQAILYAKIIRFSERTTPLSKTEKPAYLKRATEITTESGLKESRIDYIKTTYLEYARQSKSMLTVEFTLLHLKTGEIMVTDVFTLEDGDNLEYAEYGGDFKNLVPGEWKKKDVKSETDKIYDDGTNVKKLQDKLTVKKEFREGPQLTAQLIQNASQRIAEKIEQYNPEK
jgi:hypothetical protein